MQGSVLKFREVGDPVLKQKCSIPFDLFHPKPSLKWEQTIADLKATFEYNVNVCMGIAAPQIGSLLRIIVIGVKKEICNYDGAIDFPMTIMINPNIIMKSKATTLEYEGCASIPILRGKVERSKKISVEYYDENFNYQVIYDVEGFLARLIQHEVDHLDGICFLDRVKDNSTIVTAENLKKIKDVKKK